MGIYTLCFSKREVSMLTVDMVKPLWFGVEAGVRVAT